MLISSEYLNPNFSNIYNIFSKEFQMKRLILLVLFTTLFQVSQAYTISLRSIDQSGRPLSLSNGKPLYSSWQLPSKKDARKFKKEVGEIIAFEQEINESWPKMAEELGNFMECVNRWVDYPEMGISNVMQGEKEDKNFYKRYDTLIMYASGGPLSLHYYLREIWKTHSYHKNPENFVGIGEKPPKKITSAVVIKNPQSANSPTAPPKLPNKNSDAIVSVWEEVFTKPVPEPTDTVNMGMINKICLPIENSDFFKNIFSDARGEYNKYAREE
jgi:hypothetical protein